MKNAVSQQNWRLLNLESSGTLHQIIFEKNLGFLKTDAGIACEQISLDIAENEFNKKYLQTKAERLGHARNLGGK